ncbi:MAG: YwmB family TATA-box binding protein [Tissierellaceae bacterium]
MKKILIFALIVLLLIPTFTMAGKKYTEEEILLGMLRELRGDFLEGEINMGGSLLDRFIGAQEIKELGDRVKERLEIWEIEREEVHDEDFSHLAIYGYNVEENPVTVILSSFQDFQTNIGETTLFVNVIKDDANFNINDIIDKIENIFSDFGRTADLTTCVIGTIEGRLNSNHMEMYGKKAMKKYRGKIVEKYVDQLMSSFTIYTPLIENHIFSYEKRVNLNMAIRYNEYENKTYIWIGTPIITTGY